MNVLRFGFKGQLGIRNSIFKILKKKYSLLLLKIAQFSSFDYSPKTMSYKKKLPKSFMPQKLLNLLNRSTNRN
ncbi:hypothetical protein BpHYR1_052808 [Brachionus plicatilis]|uniref:Uncharacterized protein n=1 Tax=Brachionus plicatilis TaxID=10195 RepID=A0A3M7R1G0_BRAPC|nr:hypothetical protein BpHYR1_052808 [Brachionus plicatilis]